MKLLHVQMELLIVSCKFHTNLGPIDEGVFIKSAHDHSDYETPCLLIFFTYFNVKKAFYKCLQKCIFYNLLIH